LTVNTTARIWRWPSALAVASLAGLLSALLADGGWDVLSWLLLGAVLLVGAVFATRRFDGRR
jgi:hypothetical protein